MICYIPLTIHLPSQWPATRKEHTAQEASESIRSPPRRARSTNLINLINLLTNHERARNKLALAKALAKA